MSMPKFGIRLHFPKCAATFKHGRQGLHFPTHTLTVTVELPGSLITRVMRVTLEMYSVTVTNDFIKRLISSVIQVSRYESNVFGLILDYFKTTCVNNVKCKAM